MNYKFIYDRLIERAHRRVTPNGYYEKHHIVPRSLGGLDVASNIVNLTLKEHRHAHLLLFKIHRAAHPNLVYSIYAFYSDANPQRVAFRAERRIVRWIRKAASLIASAAIRERGYGMTTRFNALPIEERRRKVGLA